MKLEAKTEKEMREVDNPWPKTEDELMSYIRSCLSAVDAPKDVNHDDMGDAYGRCVYAMSLAAIAAFNYVAHVEGVTGFQASCADMDFIKRSRHIKGPFGIYKVEDLLYPQYDIVGSISDFINDEDCQKYLKEEAQKLLDESGDHAVPNVINHWKKLAGAA